MKKLVQSVARSRLSVMCSLVVGLIACFGPWLFDGVTETRLSMVLGGIFAAFCAVVLVMSYLPRWQPQADEQVHKKESAPR